MAGLQTPQQAAASEIAAIKLGIACLTRALQSFAGTALLSAGKETFAISVLVLVH